MEVMYPRCAGLDVHKDSVFARVRCVCEPVHDEVRNFGTTTSALYELNEWLGTHGVTHVAMEATGVHWKPVWHMLEESFALILTNAQHIRNVPGRKTDVSDATWIADLLAHGSIRSSFVPPVVIHELRDLTRSRKQLVRETAQHNLRIQKTLEDANLKLGSVLSDVLGKSGRAILQAIIAGESNPEKLADLAYGNAKRKRAELIEALRGRVRPHHQAPIQDLPRLLTTMPGVSDVTAQVMVAEIGVDMERFPSAGHLVSWAGLCPKNDESAGKRRSTRLRQGAPWLKTTLVTSAWGAVRQKDSNLQAQFHRLRARRGAKKAIVAVAASMLTAAYHMLKNGVEYQDRGADHFTRRDKSKAIQRLVRRLNELGCEVQLNAQAA
jgi:transposase